MVHKRANNNAGGGESERLEAALDDGVSSFAAYLRTIAGSLHCPSRLFSTGKDHFLCICDTGVVSREEGGQTVGGVVLDGYRAVRDSKRCRVVEYVQGVEGLG